MAACSSTKQQSASDDAIDTWESLARIPILSSARLAHVPKATQPVSIELLFRQACLSRSAVVFHSQTMAVSQDKGELIFRSPTLEQSRAHILGQVVHEQSGRKAVFIAHERSSNATSTAAKVMLVEIWDENGLLSSHELQNREGKAIHGRVHRLNSSFGGAAWSPDGTKIVYSAEREPPTSDDWHRHRFRTANASSSSSSSSSESSGEGKKLGPGMKYEHVDTWGEQMNGSVLTRLFVVDVTCGVVDELKGIDATLACGEPQWTVDGRSVVFVGTDVEAHTRRFGMVYCTNRPSQLYAVPAGNVGGAATAGEDAEAEEKKQKTTTTTTMVLLSSTSLGGVRSPRFSPSGCSLVYLDVSSMSTHRSCDRLLSVQYSIDGKFGAPAIVIDTVEACRSDEFPGLSCQSLPERPWLSESQLLLSSIVRSNTLTIRIDVQARTSATFEAPRQCENLDVSNLEVLDVHKSFVLLEQVKFNESPILFLVALDPSTHQSNWATRLTKNVSIERVPQLASIVASRKIFPVPGAPEGSDETYEGFHLTRANCTSTADRALMVMPHGGPHSCFTPYWNVSLMTFFLSGFDLLLVNYRGSVGFGKRFVDLLPGHCGTMDVADVHAAIHQITADHAYKGVVLHGGSHGGFLVGHLVGQFPDLAVAACLRNPVTNMASMVSASDIRDWVFVESGGVDSFSAATGPQTAEQNELMFKNSPIAHAHKVKTPCLILIGSNDLRVPPYQGREYHFALKGRGVATRLIEYSDNHTLSDVPHDFDGAINAIQWFTKHLHQND